MSQAIAYREMCRRRQEFNLKIADTLKGTAWHEEAEEFERFVQAYPDQRAGQIMCNYMCPDYRDPEPCVRTRMIMEFFFPGNPDPFFEESFETYQRLIGQSK